MYACIVVGRLFHSLWVVFFFVSLSTGLKQRLPAHDDVVIHHRKYIDAVTNETAVP